MLATRAAWPARSGHWWLAVDSIDVLWAICAGLLIGTLFGKVIGKLVVYLRSHHKESIGLDEFLALGLIGLAYGVATLVTPVASWQYWPQALRYNVSRSGTGKRVQPAEISVALDEQGAGSDGHRSEACQRLHDASGAWFQRATGTYRRSRRGAGDRRHAGVQSVSASTAGFVLLFFVVVRPVSVWLGLLGAPVSRDQRVLISWFGIRGIGSIYYLMYALNHGMPQGLAETVIAITLATVTVSIVLHGISVTPLMAIYARRKVEALQLNKQVGESQPELRRCIRLQPRGISVG